ncbi:homoserine dehydrogenase [Tropheryma whipplei]|uniref:homoserine dehydrogenase n=1 Tax=Tropheryma whipplei TaxID=2039 RepID=UPI0004AFB2AF|nr:homoserine dehydrogenase [Tropheryma whipplei]
MDYRSLKLALFGAGRVGSCVARFLLSNADELKIRTGGLDIELIGIGVKDLSKSRELDASYYTDDLEGLILRADVVIELIGGLHPAKELITRALQVGADVVSANKTLISEHGRELLALASSVGAQFLYEAAVCAAIPVIRPLKDSLSGDVIQKISGIVNGTTNFILDRMESTGDSLENALKVAQDLGYAESDPSADIEGHDAAAKATILASLAFHADIPRTLVYREGISNITQETISAARASNKFVRLLAICERMANDTDISVRVHPALIDRKHPLAAVRGNKNAIFVQAKLAGPLMFYGSGAGGLETASAILGDVVSIARRYKAGSIPTSEIWIDNRRKRSVKVSPIDLIKTRYQFVLFAIQSPEALAQIARTFAECKVLLDSLVQSRVDCSNLHTKLSESDVIMRLVVVTEVVTDSAISSVIVELKNCSHVVSIVSVMRIEQGGFDETGLALPETA